MSVEDEMVTTLEIPVSTTPTGRTPYRTPSPEEEDDDGTLAPGTAAGNWIIDCELTKGGGGQIYQAHHAQLQRVVAVKVLLKSLASHPETVKRFLQEAVSVNMIRHPSIVDVFDVGTLADGRPYLVMELLQGQTLQQAIRRKGRLATEEAVQILEPLCDALDAAHAAGFVHRDVKAANVHIGERNGKPRVTLLDFGIAKALRVDAPGAGMTARGTRLGSVTSMAPEQVLGKTISPSTDVYALGALLFRMLTGGHPFAGESISELERMHLEAAVPNVADFAPVSRDWNVVIKTAMAKNAADRYPSTRAFMAAVKHAAYPFADQQQAQKAVTALGVLVALEAQSEGGDAALAAVMSALEDVEQLLADAQFPFVRVVGASVLGMRPLLDASVHPQACTEALAMARALVNDFKNQSPPLFSVRVALHLDDVAISTAQPPLLLGGPLLDVQAWAPPGEDGHLWASDAVLQALNA